MMKNLLLLLLVVGIGIVSGVVLAVVQAGASSARTALLPEELEKRAPDDQLAAQSDTPSPKVVVDNETFDFGTMDRSGRSSHKFTITNQGNAPLKLIKGKTTCKCTMAKLDQESVMPGESTKIKIEWTARKEHLGPFEQTATIFTNDPQRPELSLKIKGWTMMMLQFVPDELILGPISAGRSATAKIRLLAHTDEPVKILVFEYAEPETAEFFDVDITPLSDEELKQETNTKSGYLIGVTVKSGLPQGTFQQTIRFRTTLPTVEMVELPVKGLIVSDISIIGRGWNKTNGLLTFGMVDSVKGDTRTLRLVARGPHRKGLTFKVAEVWPAKLLVAELGKTTEINQGAATQTPLEIQIPKGSLPANHLASEQGTPGRIVLETNHPHVPKIVIRVQFLVKGG